MSSETEDGGLGTRHPYGLSISSLGSQLSAQILVEAPLPMRLIRPCLRVSLPYIISLHTWLGCPPKLASRMSEFG